MTRLLIPSSFTHDTSSTSSRAAVSLTSEQGHRLSVQPFQTPGGVAVRVVHELPRDRYQQKMNTGVEWEDAKGVEYSVEKTSDGLQLVMPTSGYTVKIDFSDGGCPRLQWFDEKEPLLADSATRAYTYDALTGGVMHYVERENYLPLDEDEFTTDDWQHDERNEFIYGLGESRGTMEKSGKVFTMEGRDALSYDWEHGDPLYKLQPYYTVFNKRSKRWYGLFYNNVSDSSLDMGAEHDVLWGCYRSYKAACGPLDYYVILGDGTLPSITTALASLLSPTAAPSAPSPRHPISASPTLPPLSQFGYLSSSLSLAAEPKAQEAIIDFLRTSRKEGFAVDGLYLSSGWCQEEVTDNRHYFAWNTSRYPSPSTFGHTVESASELGVQVIVNVKPWLLDTHPMLKEAERTGAFVKAAANTGNGEAEADVDTAQSQRDWVWSSGFAAHALGRYIDYSSTAGSKWWSDAIQTYLLKNGLTGVWIDNNEMAGMVDGHARFRGQVGMWGSRLADVADNVEKRMGWGGGVARVGSVGKAANTMGMARATFESLLSARPNDRPVIVSRSGLPGIQAYAHASWSGDNSTTWKALKWGTKMTLSVGMSFGPGLYGHDIGGFAGKHHPSPELLVRWCQNGAWHSRFTVHSWKEVSTTMWMYESSHPEVTQILRDVLDLRYRLAPTFYSLYVAEYQRKGWPLLKPLLWHHSIDPRTLKIDEDFLFGSHVLVASVVEKDAKTRKVYLPGQANDGEKGLQWCELDTGKWHDAGDSGKTIIMDAPLSRTPVLVRAGGCLVFGGTCRKNVYDGTSSRTVLIFPRPRHSTTTAGMRGSFTLIEDDFRSNDHSSKGVYTELRLSFEVVDDAIEVDYDVVHGEWKLPYDSLAWHLPTGDGRTVRVKPGRAEGRMTKEDGVQRFEMPVSV